MSEAARAPSLCQVLEWDSEFFGRRIARYGGTRWGPADAAAVAEECRQNGIECVYILADAGDTESVANLQRAGAYLADIRVTFATATDRHARLADADGGAIDGRAAAEGAAAGAAAAAGAPRVRAAVAADIPALSRIAAVSHRDTRFYADRHFDAARCDRFYQVWIENSCRGYADAVLTADVDGRQAAGYVTCHRTGDDGRGRIGLFAVAESAQGRGVGKALIRCAQAWFATNGIAAMTVSTQLRNIRGVRFYGSAGLLIDSVGLWFHLWPRDAHG